MSQEEKYTVLVQALQNKAAEILPKGSQVAFMDHGQEAMLTKILIVIFMCCIIVRIIIGLIGHIGLI